MVPTTNSCYSQGKEAGPMVKGVSLETRDRFARTPWTEESEEWQALDQRLPMDIWHGASRRQWKCWTWAFV